MTSNQPSSFFPSLSGYYRDPGNDIHNILFPTVSNYQDGRLLVRISSKGGGNLYSLVGYICISPYSIITFLTVYIG